MEQVYANYTEEDFSVWKILFERQSEQLKHLACEPYHKTAGDLKAVLHADSIPKFSDLDEALLAKTGWSIEVVPGLIPVVDFFKLLSERRFCSSTWLRKMSELDYLEEPDMFHDIFGHIPLLMNREYADFMQKLGALGVQFADNASIIKTLRAIYWYTIEFGLIDHDDPKIYGAGIISSYGESKHIHDDPKVVIKPFAIQDMVDLDIVTSEIQYRYYTIASFEELYAMLEKIEALFLSVRE